MAVSFAQLYKKDKTLYWSNSKCLSAQDPMVIFIKMTAQQVKLSTVEPVLKAMFGGLGLPGYAVEEQQQQQ